MGREELVAIVTGSSAGIGKAIALGLAGTGYRVVVTSRTLARAAQVADEIGSGGGRAFPVAFDLEYPESVDRLVDAVVAEYDRIDILVNNAFSYGTLPPAPLQALSFDQLAAGLDSNVTRTLYLTGRCYPCLKRGRGKVLTIGSVVVNRPMLGIPLYAIAKGALTQMTKVLAAEWAKDGIAVNQINPGVVWSDAHKSIGIPAEQVPLVYEFYRQFHPLGRVGKPEDIAQLAISMLAGETEWLTGAVIDLDGGYSVQGIPLPAG